MPVSPPSPKRRIYLDLCFFHPFPDGNVPGARLALDHTLTRANLSLLTATPLFTVARTPHSRALEHLVNLLTTSSRRVRALAEYAGTSPCPAGRTAQPRQRTWVGFSGWVLCSSRRPLEPPRTRPAPPTAARMNLGRELGKRCAARWRMPYSLGKSDPYAAQPVADEGAD